MTSTDLLRAVIHDAATLREFDRLEARRQFFARQVRELDRRLVALAATANQEVA